MSNWNIDLAHSEIGFSVRHMMFAKVRGTFGSWETDLELNLDDLTASKVKVDVDVSSIDTKNADRDNHLRSGDFFDTENHPKMTFESGEIRSAGDGFEVDGTLTIRGTSQPITLNVELTGQGKDPWGNERAGFRVTAEINRKDFGLTWNQALETGGVLVGEKVGIEVEAQTIAAAAAAE